MGIQYMTDEAGRKVAVVISLAQWEAIQSELRGDAVCSPQDEADRREAYDELAAGESLDLGRAMADW
jgi:PHD/YefM family antitoxin component YafN of YafNO toxin-antitoxin module